MPNQAALLVQAAWARIHRKPALSVVTGGPGHTPWQIAGKKK